MSLLQQKEKYYLGGAANTSSEYILNGTYNGSKKKIFSEIDGVGGGASDFRTKNGDWINNLKYRIIVAGGGGAGRSPISGDNIGEYKGGRGGGINGTSGEYTVCPPAYGTQETSYLPPCNDPDIKYVNGDLGIGRNGGWAGGGGGYYGGGYIQYSAGGGGSGYVDPSLISIGNYSAVTSFSEHYGFGYAKISILLNINKSLKQFMNTCKIKRPFIIPFTFISIIILS